MAIQKIQRGRAVWSARRAHNPEVVRFKSHPRYWVFLLEKEKLQCKRKLQLRWQNRKI